MLCQTAEYQSTAFCLITRMETSHHNHVMSRHQGLLLQIGDRTVQIIESTLLSDDLLTNRLDLRLHRGLHDALALQLESQFVTLLFQYATVFGIGHSAQPIVDTLQLG